jgi:hypothetical protein
MAHALTQRAEFKTGSTLSYPVIIKGREGYQYHLIRINITTTGQACIGHLMTFDANSVTAADYAADGEEATMVLVDSPFNLAQLQRANAGSALSKALTFNTGYLNADAALLMPGCIVSLLIEASCALEVGNRVEAGGVGAVQVFANGPVLCTSLVYNTSGTGTDYGAFYWHGAMEVS